MLPSTQNGRAKQDAHRVYERGAAGVRRELLADPWRGLTEVYCVEAARSVARSVA